MRPAWAPVVPLVAVALIAVGCGVDTSTDATTGSGVPLPKAPGQGQAEQRLLERYYQGLIAVGTKRSVARCYQRQIRDLPPVVLGEITSSGASGDTLAKYNSRFYKACVPEGTSAISPAISESQVKKTRALLKRALKPVLESEGAFPNQIKCVGKRIDELPISELKLLTGPRSVTTDAIAKAMFERCGASPE